MTERVAYLSRPLTAVVVIIVAVILDQAIKIAVERFERKLQRMQSEPRGFVAGVRRAVPECNARRSQPACTYPQQRAQSRVRAAGAFSRLHPGSA